MPDDIIKVGYHDKGLWDAANKINADKKPIAQNVNINDAIAKAKANKGAELILVDDSGNAKVHSLKMEDSLVKENKTIDNKELFRGKTKLPLNINDNIASAFNSRAAFLVDEKNNITYLGDKVKQTNAETILKDAERFVSAPNKNKVDAAYTMAKEAGNEKKIEVRLANNLLDDLSANYKNTTPADNAVSFLKPGDVKTKMESLLTNLKSVDKVNNNETNELKSQLNTRTEKYQKEIAEPAKRLNKANTAWNTAANQEEQKVQSAFHNLRESKMPGIYRLEDNLSLAESERDGAKSDMNNSIQNRVNIQSNVEELERIPGEIESLKNRNRNLVQENRGMATALISYLSLTRSQISSELSSKKSESRRLDIDLSAERSKPSRPVGGGSGNSVTDDPFSKKNSVTDDPFSSGSVNYRDDSKISRLESEIRSLNSEIRDLDSRESSLSSLSFRVAVDTDISTLSTFFMDLSYTDRVAINRYSDEYERNKREISQNNNTIREKDSTYDNNINSARNSLSNAISNEERAKSNYSNSEARVAQLSNELAQLKANPIEDTNAKVLPNFNTHKKSLENQEKTVGENAPLTKEKRTAQSVVDEINKNYNTDKSGFESRIRDSAGSANNKAQDLIKDTRNKL